MKEFSGLTPEIIENFTYQQIGAFLSWVGTYREEIPTTEITLLNLQRCIFTFLGVKDADKAKKKDSLVQAAYENDVPIFCPAFSDSSAGFGLVMHQMENEDNHVSIDSVKDFRELTEIKIRSPISGLFIIGGGVPKNFAQDTVVCAEVLGKTVDMHKYAVQITVADVRDGACSSSTLKEACSCGKVDTGFEQMVYAEATSVLPLIVSYVYHKRNWENRPKRHWSKIFE